MQFHDDVLIPYTCLLELYHSQFSTYFRFSFEVCILGFSLLDSIWNQIMWNSIFQTREFVWMLLIWVLAHFTHCMWQIPTVLLVRERNGINLLMLLIKKRDESAVQLQCCVMRAVGVFLSVLITTQPSLDPLMTVASWDPWVTAAAAGH